MNIETLRTELVVDPLARGYSGMTDAQAAASLNVVNRLIQRSVSAKQLLRWSAGVDGLTTLKTAAASGNKDKRRLSEAALAMISSPHVADFDVQDPEVAAMLAATVALGIFTQAEVDALNARGQVTISRAAELGLPEVTELSVQAARN